MGSVGALLLLAPIAVFSVVHRMAPFLFRDLCGCHFNALRASSFRPFEGFAADRAGFAPDCRVKADCLRRGNC
jgi:hypothetical protein